MRMVLAAVPIALLAACSGGGVANKAGNAAATGNAAAPAANAGAPAGPIADARRVDEIRECSDDVRPEVPEGTDLNALCGCAVDRMQTGERERQAMEQCAAQLGIQPRGR